MGPFDREIIDYVDSCGADGCLLDELIKYASKIPDYGAERAMNDVENLRKDGVLIIDEESGIIHLTDYAKQPPVPLPNNSTN